MKLNVLFFLAILSCLNLFSQPAGYGFGKQVSIQSSQVSGGSPLSDFPVLISFTDNDLRTTANGGNVENVNGFDIIFTTNTCFVLVQLDHQIESYNPVTGEYVAWVRIPSLSNSADTDIFMFYGNSSVASDPSTSAVWTTHGYDGVWHLHDDFSDASGSGNNGTNNGSTDVSPAHNFGDGQNFVDPNHWIELTSHPNRNGSFSYSGWVRTNDRSRAGQRVICDDATNSNGCHAISIGDPGAGRVRFYIRGLNPVSLDSPVAITNNTWHYVTATYNSGSGLKSLYVDGALVASATATGSLGTPTGNASIGGEVASGESGNRFHGDLDEVRAFPGVLSASWIATEFNNQNNPSTFYTVTAEMTASELCTTLPIELLSFDAKPNEDKVDLTWVTATEINNDFFTVQKSKNGIDWEDVLEVDGAGNSNQVLNYFDSDYSPYSGLSYYRLKQTDYDGKFTFSNVVPVKYESSREGNMSLFPNPIKGGDLLNLSFEDIEEDEVLVVLRDVTGKEFYSKLFIGIENGKLIGLPIEKVIPSGLYLITATSENRIYSQKLLVK